MFALSPFYVLQVTALIPVLAANTAFNGFLRCARSCPGRMPRQPHNRGTGWPSATDPAAVRVRDLADRDLNAPTRLIQPYIIGVFVAVVCSQTGMIRHWNRNLRITTDPRVRRHMKRTRVINTIGAIFTGLVLVIVLVAKFASGAWIVVVAMPAIWLTMRGIRSHYANVAIELTQPADLAVTLPASNRAIVLVSKVHLPTLRALA